MSLPAAAPLAFPHPGGGAGRGAAALGRRLAPGLRLAQGTGPEGERSLRFRHGRLDVGGLQLHALALGPCRLSLHSEARHCLVLPLAGEATLRGAGRRAPLTADAGHSAVLLPPGDFQLHCERLSAALVSVPRPDLARTAGRLARPGAAARLESRLERCWQWREGDPLQRDLLSLLRQTLRLLESAAGGNGPLPIGGEALASWILQPLALLLLLEPTTAEAAGDGAGGAAECLDELIAHIEANLDRPLSLGELSERSGYARRSLQYAFQNRFGCGPMQWVRRRRLEAARQALQQAGAGEPVRSIARRCGYTDLSSFSRDIQRAFGRPPSALRPGGLWPEPAEPPTPQ